MSRRRFAGVKAPAKPTTWHDEGFDKLTSHLYKWLMQQPEWLAVLSADRTTRKRYAAQVADMVTRVPEYISKPPVAQTPVVNIRVGEES